MTYSRSQDEVRTGRHYSRSPPCLGSDAGSGFEFSCAYCPGCFPRLALGLSTSSSPLAVAATPASPRHFWELKIPCFPIWNTLFLLHSSLHLSVSHSASVTGPSVSPSSQMMSLLCSPWLLIVIGPRVPCYLILPAPPLTAFQC